MTATPIDTATRNNQIIQQALDGWRDDTTNVFDLLASDATWPAAFTLCEALAGVQTHHSHRKGKLCADTNRTARQTSSGECPQLMVEASDGV